MSNYETRESLEELELQKENDLIDLPTYYSKLEKIAGREIYLLTKSELNRVDVNGNEQKNYINNKNKTAKKNQAEQLTNHTKNKIKFYEIATKFYNPDIFKDSFEKKMLIKKYCPWIKPKTLNTKTPVGMGNLFNYLIEQFKPIYNQNKELINKAKNHE